MRHNVANKGSRKANDVTRQITDLEKNVPYYKEGSISDTSSDVSVRLYEVLDIIGASDGFRKLRQECAILSEIMNTILGKKLHGKTSTFIFGSSSEGTTIPEFNSDTDMLVCYNDRLVVENLNEAKCKESFLIIEDEISKPGYVKLQSLLNNQSQTVRIRNLSLQFEESDSAGRICAKHISSLEFIGSGIFERNGPADTNTYRNMDFVPSFRCRKIPEFASEWIVRRRLVKWPTESMLEKMATMDCFVVGVGHPASIERQIEWRFSFSLQERELMFSMNCVQHKCYIVLKIIKKSLIEPIVGQSLSSYHLKTCMFYVMEHTKSKIWTPIWSSAYFYAFNYY